MLLRWEREDDIGRADGNHREMPTRLVSPLAERDGGERKRDVGTNQHPEHATMDFHYVVACSSEVSVPTCCICNGSESLEGT